MELFRAFISRVLNERRNKIFILNDTALCHSTKIEAVASFAGKVESQFLKNGLSSFHDLFAYLINASIGH